MPRALLLALALISWPFPARARAQLTIGYSPADVSEKTATNGKRLSEYLQRKTGYAVKTFVSKDYASLVEAFRAGKIDFAFLPPFSYVQIEDAGAHILLKAVRHGRASYYSTLIVRSDSGLNAFEDLRGKRMGWVDRDSAAGYVIPRAEIAARNLDPDAYLGPQSFLGGHDAVVRAVLARKVDAGAVWTNDPTGKKGAWNRFLRKPEDLSAIKALAVFGPIPGDALASTDAVWKGNRGMVEKVTKTLQRMGSALDGQQILRDIYGIDQMVPATPKDFDSVRAAARAVPQSR